MRHGKQTTGEGKSGVNIKGRSTDKCGHIGQKGRRGNLTTKEEKGSGGEENATLEEEKGKRNGRRKDPGFQYPDLSPFCMCAPEMLRFKARVEKPMND